MVALFRRESGPTSVHFLRGAQRSADQKHRARMSVIGAAGAVLLHRAAKLRAGQNHHVIHAVAQIGHQRGDALRKVAQASRQLPPCAALIHVRVPATHVGEGHFKPHVRLDQLRELQQPLPEL